VSTFRWTPDNIDRLLACKTDAQLNRAFPGRTLGYLKEQQRKFRIVRPVPDDNTGEVPDNVTSLDDKRARASGASATPTQGNLAVVPDLEEDPEEEIKADGETEADDEEAELVQESVKDRKISRLEDEIKHLRKLYKGTTKESAALDAMVEAIYEVVPTMQTVRVPKRRVITDDVEEESLVLLLGDLHIGEVVDPDQTSGIAEFNVDIARRRIQYTVDTAIKIARDKMAKYHFRRLVAPILGDVVSGIIHDELRVNDEIGIVGQLIVAVEILAEAILKLCQEFEAVHVPCVVGNHGRVTEERYFKGKATNNYDYLVYKMLEKVLADQPNLTWDIPKAFFTVVTVEKSRFLLLHGDVVKSWMGIPFYGLQRAYLKWRALHADYGMPFEHMIVGHYHNPNMQTIVRYELIINGCIKGGDEYSIGAIAAACDPVQIMFGVHPEKGITHRWYINSKSIGHSDQAAA
jgi:hypothetical protein